MEVKARGLAAGRPDASMHRSKLLSLSFSHSLQFHVGMLYARPSPAPSQPEFHDFPPHSFPSRLLCGTSTPRGRRLEGGNPQNHHPLPLILYLSFTLFSYLDKKRSRAPSDKREGGEKNSLTDSQTTNSARKSSPTYIYVRDVYIRRPKGGLEKTELASQPLTLSDRYEAIFHGEK